MSAATPLATPAHAATGGAPSDWLLRWAHLLPAGASALDLACGPGRHVRWLAARGLTVCAIDRDAAALAGLQGLPGVQVQLADLEAGDWPLTGRTFDLVLVTHYLWRARLPLVLDAVAPGGLLVYETFARGQETVGRPSRPEFLLRPGELLDLARPALRVLGYEDGWLLPAQGAAPARRVQRIVARRPAAGEAADATWPAHLSLPASLAGGPG
jgi:SAM-dependent methyltransferase